MKSKNRNIVSFSNNKVAICTTKILLLNYASILGSTITIPIPTHPPLQTTSVEWTQGHVPIVQVLPGFKRHVFSGIRLVLSSLHSPSWPRILILWSQPSNCCYYVFVPTQLALWYFTTIFNLICLEISLGEWHLFLVLKFYIPLKMSTLLNIFNSLSLSSMEFTILGMYIESVSTCSDVSLVMIHYFCTTNNILIKIYFLLGYIWFL